tara:strand:- start:13406 stop:13558 length:153 start_codon:yes stop_codon:yes gene_type:complete
MKSILIQAITIIAEKMTEYILDYLTRAGRERIKERKIRKKREKDGDSQES